MKDRYPLGYTDLDDGKLAPQYVIERIGQLSGPEAIYAAGVVSTRCGSSVCEVRKT